MTSATERVRTDLESLLATSRRAYWKVTLFVRSWGWVERELGREPTLTEFAEYWRESREEALAELDLLRRNFPDEATPHRVVAALDAGEDRSRWDVCVRCGVQLSKPPELTVEVRSQAWKLGREKGLDSRYRILRYLVDEAGLDERSAKALALHVAGTGPACNWCGAPLDQVDPGEPTVCRSCRSLNLVWG